MIAARVQTELRLAQHAAPQDDALWRDREHEVRAESADEWIATLLEDDDASWRERSRAAADFINRSFSAQRQRDDLARALRWVG